MPGACGHPQGKLPSIKRGKTWELGGGRCQCVIVSPVALTFRELVDNARGRALYQLYIFNTLTVTRIPPVADIWGRLGAGNAEIGNAGVLDCELVLGVEAVG